MDTINLFCRVMPPLAGHIVTMAALTTVPGRNEELLVQAGDMYASHCYCCWLLLVGCWLVVLLRYLLVFVCCYWCRRATCTHHLAVYALRIRPISLAYAPFGKVDSIPLSMEAACQFSGMHRGAPKKKGK